MTDRTIRLGTRSSALALVQTQEAVDALRDAHPGISMEVVQITPDGDRRKNAPLLSLGRGTFVKGLEQALIDGLIDVAVNSSKDMPSALPEGLAIAAFTARSDARDVLVNRFGMPLAELPTGARLGTSSPRRTGQILAVRPDVEFVPIRGNVDTRMSKVGVDGYDGVVLAAAGLERLGRLAEVTEFLAPDVCVPDAGQGALALEIRSDDQELAHLLSSVNHANTSVEVTAERAFVESIGGGCRVPVAAYAVIEDDELVLLTAACLPDGSKLYRSGHRGPAGDPTEAGRSAARTLIETGADAILYGDGSA